MAGQEALHPLALSLALLPTLGDMLCCHCGPLSVEVLLSSLSCVLEQSFSVSDIVTLGVGWLFICGGLSGDWEEI